MNDTTKRAEEILHYPMARMRPESSGPLDQAKICEVDFDVTSQPGRIIFHYSRIGRVSLDGSLTLDALVRDLCRGNFPTVMHKPNEQPCNPPRKSSMSLNNKDDAYLIFVLKKDRAWQFSRRGPVFTVGICDPAEEDCPPIEPRDYYKNPVAYDENGNALGDTTGGRKSLVAMFEALGAKANQAQGGRNADSFNLHVDLNENDDPHHPRHVPVIIDPDVGHPGGSD